MSEKTYTREEIEETIGNLGAACWHDNTDPNRAAAMLRQLLAEANALRAETARLRTCGNSLQTNAHELLVALETERPLVLGGGEEPLALPYFKLRMSSDFWTGRKGGDHEVDLRDHEKFVAFVESVRLLERDGCDAQGMAKALDEHIDRLNQEMCRIANVLGYEDAESFEDKDGVPQLWTLVQREVTMPVWRIIARRVREYFFPLREV